MKNGISLLSFPMIYLQGMWVRLKTPRLPDAGGAKDGIAYPDKSANGHKTIRIIFIGESTVAGIGAPTHELALTGRTAKILADQTGHNIQWSAIGLSGATVKMMTEKLTPTLNGKETDLVILPIGVNDVTGLTSLKKWDENVRQLICSIRSHLGNVRIVMSGPPPLNCCPGFPRLLGQFLGARSRMLDSELTHIASSIYDVMHIPMIDNLSEQHFCEDKFHPSVEGYDLWANYLSKSIVLT